MWLIVLSGVIGAVCFGVVGGLGTRLSAAVFGTLERESDGPPPIAVPDWVFIAVPAAIGFAVGIRGVEPLRAVMLLIAVLALVVCAATDCRSGKLPDVFTAGPLAVLLAVSAFRHEWAPVLGALFAFVPFAVIAASTRGRGMGWGDVKLAAFGGALVGMSGITLAVGLASAGAFIGGALRGRVRAPIAFGPYLAVAIGVALGLGAPS
jgi:prepilin signal peptidase PulO-like enzyme (type II secretory pathway)